jgi:hypothetical protein
LIGLVLIVGHDKEATTRPWANILLINITAIVAYLPSIYPKITEIIYT